MSNNFEEAEAELQRIESNFRLSIPRTAPAELQRLVNQELRALGIEPSALREHIVARKEAEDEATRAKIFAAGAKFMASRPESDSVNGYVPCRANEAVMFAYMQNHGLDFTSPHSYEETFLAVRDQLISPKQHGATSQRIRKVDGQIISHEALDKLSARDLERLLQNPRIMEAVNNLPPRTR